MQKFNYIDSLRGWAILAVVFIHSGHHGVRDYLPDFIVKLVYAGQYGVQLFFVVSAFTLFFSMSNRSRSSTETAGFFFIRRFFRIAPMYYLAIVYYSFHRYVGFKFFATGRVRDPVPQDALLSNMFFVQGFNPVWINGIVPGGWSIAVEMLFYLMVPLLFKVIKNAQHAILFLMIALFFSAATYLVLRETAAWNKEWFYMSLPNQLPVFATGFIAYFIIAGKRINHREGLLLMLFATVFYVGFSTISKHLVFAASFLWLLVTLSQRQYILFVNRLTIFFGKVSYSMYIIHFAVIFWFGRLGIMNLIEIDSSLTAMINLVIRYILVVIITGLISYITYKAVELPFQKLGMKMIRRIKYKHIGLPI